MKIKILLGSISFFFLVISPVSAEKIGWMTDIHAGAMKTRKKSETNIYYPRQYKTYYRKAILEIEQAGVETLIVSGDLTDHSRQIRYARQLKRIARKNGIKMIWVLGNHDSSAGVRQINHVSKSYFLKNMYGLRFIFLDSLGGDPVGYGRVGKEQMEWLDKAIKGTTRSIIVFMHHPIFDRSAVDVWPSHQRLEQRLSADQKVKMVFAGHWHSYLQKDLNGIQYFIGNPLTLKSAIGSYYLIDLESMTVEVRLTAKSEDKTLKTKQYEAVSTD